MGRFDNRTWVIITLADYSNSELDTLVDNAIQRSKDSLRKSLDNSKALLKWDGNAPSVFDGITTYNHSEILAELAKSTWTESE